MAIKNTDRFIGFSSKNYERNKSFLLFDQKLVDEDLKNHIFTRKGERVRMPTFGTRIPDLPFQPLDDYSVAVVFEDLTAVFEYDPRVQLISLNVIPVTGGPKPGIMAVADLFYIQLNINGQLNIHIDFEGT